MSGLITAILSLITIILLVLMSDFTRIRKQNEIMIEQNKKVITLLEKIQNK